MENNRDIQRLDKALSNPETIKKLRLDRNYKDPARAQRVKLCAFGILEGLSTAQIYEKYTESWGMPFRTIQGYVRTAKKIIASEILTEDSEIRHDLIAKYQYLYQKAMNDERYSEARKILDSVAKMTQLFKVDITTKGEPVTTIEIIETRRNEDTA